MPTWLAIVLGVFVALVIILAVGGAIARKRQLERTQGRFDEHLAQVNRDLAARPRRRTADGPARRWTPPPSAAWLSERGADAPTANLTLVQIVDRPGHRRRQGRLRGRERRPHGAPHPRGRRGDEWVNEGIA